MASPLWIKICGVTNEVDGCIAARLGANAVGLNFYEDSPRYIHPEKAEFVVRGLPRAVEPVGIHVVPGPQVFAISEKLGIQTVQWHGYFRARFLRHSFSHRLIQAFPISLRSDLASISLEGIKGVLQCWPREICKEPSAILVDASVPGKFGGTGKTAPWDLLADFQPGVPLILAGGLTPENVAEAVRIVRPYGVDVASGVEKAPGKKDAEKMKRFIENAREAAEK